MIKASLKRLRVSNFKLNILLDLTQAINENLSTLELLKRYEQVLTRELNIGKIVIYNFKRKWECVLTSGVEKERLCSIDVEKELLPIHDISSFTNHPNPQLKNFDVVIPVYHKETALAFVLIGDIEEEREGISPTIKHLNFIQTLTNIIIVAIENKRLYKETIRQEALKKELELASKMQEMLIPAKNTLPNNEHIFIDSFYLPHFDVGGDYYDIIELNSDELGFCIADVSGKGISAAILMSNFQANLRALFTPEISLNELIRRLNQIVIRNTNGEKFITLFIGKYNFKTKELIYINAGHNPPVMYNTKTQSIHYLKNGCVGLGMIDDIPEINKGYIKIAKNTKLICFTDGLVEVENDQKMEFGTKPIEKYIAANLRIDEAIIELIQNLNEYRRNNPLFDDISILGFEFYCC
jgi:phosphoserine phosphatase RsbU/P